MNKIKVISLLFSLLLFCRCSQVGTGFDNPPNILFAIADDASYPDFGAYGTDWISTPAFDRIAEEGLLFTNAYTPNAKCAPSRSIILTGRYSWELEAAANHISYFPPKFKTFPEVLSENGYHVGYTGKGWAPGISLDENGQNRELLVKAYNALRKETPTTGIRDVDYAANFNHFLEQKNENQSFFFWYGGFEPHRKYEYGSGIRYGKKLSDIKKVFSFWPDMDTIRTDLLDYAFEIEYFDSQLEMMINNLEERGLLENTIIIVTADNGMPFPRIKGQTYALSNHLPLAIMWPKGIRKKGRTIEDYISFTDFAPTILEAAGLVPEETGMHPVSGESLSNLMFSRKTGKVNPERDHVLIGKERHDVGRPQNQGYPVRGIVRGDYLYLRNFKPERWPAGNPETGYLNTDGSPTKTVLINTLGTPADHYWCLNFGKRPEEELYNIKEDPECMINLSGSATHQAIKDELHQFMREELSLQKDPRIVGDGDVFEDYPIYPLVQMNYYEKYMDGKADKAGWVNQSDYRGFVDYDSTCTD